LNGVLDKQLICLCEFSPSHKWTLLYRASSHGFSSQNFHSHCDNKANTLTVIKTTNGNIFGGFTQQTWEGSGYKIDNNAFLFGLVNQENNPIKMKIKSGGQNAIYCHSGYGPTFGNGHDFYIASNSNLNQTSYSNLGVSYQQHPTHACGTTQAQSFLAGSYNFQVSEIEVFSKLEINKKKF
jgi:hypothetical protein